MSEVVENRGDAAVSSVLRERPRHHHDAASESSRRLTAIDAILAAPGVSALGESIRPGELVETELLSMARGYTMTIDSTADPGWLSVTFTRIDTQR